MPKHDLDVLRGLEEQLHQPSVRQSPETVDRLLADGYVEFGRSGRVYDKAEVMRHLAAEDAGPAATITASEFALKSLAEDVVLLTYRSVRRGADGEKLHALRSSIWTFRDGRWQMLFHQGTPTSGKP
jgi:hypothetical protein